MSCVVLVAPVGLERSGSHTPSIHSSPTGVRRRRAEAPRGAGGGGGGPGPAPPHRRKEPSIPPPEQFPCFIPAEQDFSPFCTFVAAAPPPRSPRLFSSFPTRGERCLPPWQEVVGFEQGKLRLFPGIDNRA